MQILLFLVIIMAISLVGMYFFLNFYSAVCYKFMVLSKVEAIDRLLEYGVVPNRWRIKPLEKISLLEPVLKRYYIWRLWGLLAFARSIQDEEQRQVCMDCITTLQKEWRNAESLNEMVRL